MGASVYVLTSNCCSSVPVANCFRVRMESRKVKLKVCRKIKYSTVGIVATTNTVSSPQHMVPVVTCLSIYIQAPTVVKSVVQLGAMVLSAPPIGLQLPHTPSSKYVVVI